MVFLLNTILVLTLQYGKLLCQLKYYVGCNPIQLLSLVCEFLHCFIKFGKLFIKPLTNIVYKNLKILQYSLLIIYFNIFIFIQLTVCVCILCKNSVVHFEVLLYLQRIRLVCKLYKLCLQQNLGTLINYQFIFMCCVLCTFYYYILIVHVEICRHNCCTLCNTVFNGTKNSSILQYLHSGPFIISPN